MCLYNLYNTDEKRNATGIGYKVMVETPQGWHSIVRPESSPVRCRTRITRVKGKVVRNGMDFYPAGFHVWLYPEDAEAEFRRRMTFRYDGNNRHARVVLVRWKGQLALGRQTSQDAGPCVVVRHMTIIRRHKTKRR